MRHVFVETNWVVGCVAPAHRRIPAARALLERARLGELKIHLPVICIVEARRTLQTKFQPRGEANAIGEFVRWAINAGKLDAADAETVRKTVDMFESRVRGELSKIDGTLEALKDEPGVSIFAQTTHQLTLAVDIGFTTTLAPFDQSVLAAVLGHADEIRLMEPAAELAFCELDSDLQPWDAEARPIKVLTDLYDARRIWVYGDFDLTAPPPPAGWSGGRGS